MYNKFQYSDLLFYMYIVHMCTWNTFVPVLKQLGYCVKMLWESPTLNLCSWLLMNFVNLRGKKDCYYYIALLKNYMVIFIFSERWLFILLILVELLTILFKLPFDNTIQGNRTEILFQHCFHDLQTDLFVKCMWKDH